MPINRRISIKDIAREAGVSYSTVSRALNDSPLISEEVRVRIQHIARNLGYTPNALAQSLQSNRSHSIGVIITTISDPFFADVVQGVEEAAREANLTVFLATSNNDPENEIRIIESFHRRRVDGVIIAASRIGEDYAKQLERVHFPVIMVNNQAVSENQNLHAINVDDLAGARLAVQHLFDLGHRRIGYVGVKNRPGSNARRLQGYRTMLEENGILPSPDWICMNENGITEGLDGDLRAGLELGRKVLRQGVTAVFCYCDSVAAGVLAACREQSLDVPGQVSIIGFDDSDLCQILCPPLTTIHQPMREMGQMALNMLTATLSGSPVTDQTLQPSLVTRSSTAPVVANRAFLPKEIG